MKNYIPGFFLLLCSSLLHAQTVEFHPTCHSIGVEVREIGNADSCGVEYRKTSETIWKTGFPPDRITLSGEEQYRGSLFLLEPQTAYEVRVTSFQAGNLVSVQLGQVSTLSDPEFGWGQTLKWVAPNGSGNAYTQDQPGNLTALFNSGQVSCGVTVLLMDGVYTQNGLQLTIQNPCTENTPITLMAAPGAHPVIEGGIQTPLAWTQHPSDSKLFSATIPQAAAHSNICVMDGKALYPYPSLTSELLLGGYHLAALNFGYDGFVRDENTIWIKTQAGTNPANAEITLSRSFRFLTVYGGDKDAYLKVKGIVFQHFGKPVLNPLGSAQDAYGATVFDIRNAHHVYFDSCRFDFNTSHISFTNQCNHLFIQHCTFRHDAGKWTHAMIKKSNVFVHSILYTVSSSRGRAVETAGIFIHKSRNAVIRHNLFDGLNSGIESYIDQGPLEEIDVYNNVFVDNFDAIECDGYWTNLRAWNNEFIRPMAGISAAPPLVGPRYFYRNLFHGMQGRRNEQDDPYFIGCTPVTENYMGQGIGIKTNTGNGLSSDRGNLYFFNNTFHAVDTLGFVFTSWDSEWRKALFINNIYTHEGHYPFYYFSLAGNSDYRLQSVTDNYYCYDPVEPLAVIKHIHGQYQCTEAPDVAALEEVLTSISGSPNIAIRDPMQADPGFETMTDGGFALAQGSLMIDAGTLIPGFYDYQGSKPDLGAKEGAAISSVMPDKQFLPLRVYPNPGNGLFTLEWFRQSAESSIRVVNAFGQETAFWQTNEEKISLDLRREPDGVYLIQIQSGNALYIIKAIKTN
ncbi:MAG TPA: T9SS type A sorting domain-containing protein [Saprospiraceae bacterium]|nr:T9SS type A sorting domain-containing protein [Saprospiraceae bacterium]